MIRYAISDRRLFAGSDQARQRQVVSQAAALAAAGVDCFQLREKDLDDGALLALTLAVHDAVRATGSAMQVVLNGPRHVSEQAGVAWHRSAAASHHVAPCFSCSVHTLDEVEQQRDLASLLLFAPVFNKTVVEDPVQPGAGLQVLHGAVQRARGTPVLALGGVTPGNASLCMQAGAAGVAGIRLFLQPPWGSLLPIL